MKIKILIIEDSTFIKRCIEIGKIIGEGWTSAYGGAHAEVNAIASVKNKSLLAKSTLYVSLEPCCHHGKTPPCTDLIIKHKIQRVVIGCIDSNTKVSGKGVAALEAAGCKVKVGIEEELCKIVSYCEDKANEIVSDNRVIIDLIVEKLLDVETMDGAEFRQLLSTYTVLPNKDLPYVSKFN